MNSYTQLIWIKEAFVDNSGDLTIIYNLVSWKFMSLTPWKICGSIKVCFKVEDLPEGRVLDLTPEARTLQWAQVGMFVGQVLSSWP